MRVVLTGAGICSAAGHSLAEVATFLAGSSSPFVSSEAFGLPGYAVCPVSSPDADGLGTDDAAARLRAWRRRACVQRGGRFALAAAFLWKLNDIFSLKQEDGILPMEVFYEQEPGSIDVMFYGSSHTSSSVC